LGNLFFLMSHMIVLGAIALWEVSSIPIAPQLHTELVIDTGNSRWSTTWPTHRLVLGFESGPH